MVATFRDQGQCTEKQVAGHGGKLGLAEGGEMGFLDGDGNGYVMVGSLVGARDEDSVIMRPVTLCLS